MRPLNVVNDISGRILLCFNGLSHRVQKMNVRMIQYEKIPEM